MTIFNLLFAFGNVAYADSDDEQELMKRIQARDAKALEQLYDHYNPLLYAMIISIVKEREEAEDLLQEVFLKVWEKAYSFDGQRGNVYSWIVTLARNKAIDRTRSKGYKTGQKASVSVEDDEAGIIPQGDHFDPLQSTIFSDRAELVRKALDDLPEEQRKVIKVAYYQGMTQSEIAQLLNLPLGTVKTRTRQGMIKLKNILEGFISGNDQGYRSY